MKTTCLTLVLCFLSCISFGQQNSKPNGYYAGLKQTTHTLSSIFPVDDIQSITITNYNGAHKLTQKELAFLKEQLRKAKFAGGLLVKPKHVTLRIGLKNTSVAKAGYVYATNGSIHFDGATDRYKKHFSGTYYLPLAINFDKYNNLSTKRQRFLRTMQDNQPPVPIHQP